MKYALVTGGSRGIGAQICKELSENGYFVYVNYNSSYEKANQLAAEIGGKAVGFDVSDTENAKNKINEILIECKHLDLLVNNAGVSEIELFNFTSQENADKILNINLKGTLNCSRAVVSSMVNNKSGCIINISSMWGQCGASCEVDYSASKAGVIGFTKALAKELAPSGIRVNCVSPGFITTEMNKKFTKDELEDIRDEIPLGIFGTPADIANAVIFLASEKASFITGQTLAVNGGMII
ncbi:MAG: 3-oxoacyl-ACP reductase FabG [Ruminococcus sp.]|nr:glucose 1-dehydrogenase [Ruminococcus sp.]MBR6670743.1 3-oxoacyl-ACP reductase FabG [Ruminococcus sp.]